MPYHFLGREYPYGPEPDPIGWMKKHLYPRFRHVDTGATATGGRRQFGGNFGWYATSPLRAGGRSAARAAAAVGTGVDRAWLSSTGAILGGIAGTATGGLGLGLGMAAGLGAAGFGIGSSAEQWKRGAKAFGMGVGAPIGAAASVWGMGTLAGVGAGAAMLNYGIPGGGAVLGGALAAGPAMKGLGALWGTGPGRAGMIGAAGLGVGLAAFGVPSMDAGELWEKQGPRVIGPNPGNTVFGGISNGFLFGTGIAGAVGGGLGGIAGWSAVSRLTKKAGGRLLGTGIGIAAGGLIGAMSHVSGVTDPARWTDSPIATGVGAVAAGAGLRFMGGTGLAVMRGQKPKDMRFLNFAARRAGKQLSGAVKGLMSRLSKHPHTYGLLFGSLLSLPTIFRGIAGAMAPMSEDYPEMSTGNAATVYGMDANHLNTQGLVQSMHYGRR